MKEEIKKIYNLITTILVGIVVIVVILLVGVRVFGVTPYAVLSGSMEPTYHTGSLVYVKKVDYKKLKDGDVITFMLDEDTIATHRIIEVVPDSKDKTVLRYKTKGDANNFEDASLVHYKNVIGTPVFTIPYAGYISNWIQNPPGKYLAMSAGAIIVLLAFLPDLFAEEDNKDNKKKRKKRDKEDVNN